MGAARMVKTVTNLSEYKPTLLELCVHFTNDFLFISSQLNFLHVTYPTSQSILLNGND